ncbi:hypothetical protein [Saccharopolyspora griseoalba]|uniref:Uncharacterized protein n=1 Tax=Saccharopolyspora griseoalba TaxID=1431848 RepID=A0ABW2LCA7_9PSEU
MIRIVTLGEKMRRYLGLFDYFQRKVTIAQMHYVTGEGTLARAYII